jgi:hypothetical protein
MGRQFQAIRTAQDTVVVGKDNNLAGRRLDAGISASAEAGLKHENPFGGKWCGPRPILENFRRVVRRPVVDDNEIEAILRTCFDRFRYRL